MADDLSRWLHQVRPPTAADDGWDDSRDADAVLAAVHARIAAPGVDRRSRARRAGWATGLLATAAAVVTVLSTGGTTPDGSSPVGTAPSAPRSGAITDPAVVSPALRPAAYLLHGYSSCTDLLAGLRKQTAAHVTAYGLPGVVSWDPRFRSAATPTGLGLNAVPSPTGAAAADTSTTNVQEVGVDEPDIVKTDSGRVVTLIDGVLRVVDPGSRKVTGSLDLTMYSGWEGAQLLVDGARALVLLGGAGPGSPVTFGPMPAETPYPGPPGHQRATFLFVDLSGTPRVTGSMRASGSYLDARLVGSTARIVVTSTPALTLPNGRGSNARRLAANRKAIDRAPLRTWLPHYTVTAGTTTVTRSVPCSAVSHPAEYTGTSLVTVYTVDLGHLVADPQPVTVAADGNTVYATATSLYIASNADWYRCCHATDATQRTELHRFGIGGTGRPTYLGSATLRGRLLNQYALSDYAGSLRAATTIDTAETGNSSNAVYVLDADTLKITGHLDDLGVGEQVYAVRFLGPIAYLVTFHQTDPLYVLDLRDPTAPRVAGRLKLTGYSDYLHDAGDGRLLGIGQEASRQGRIAGMQVSLFDVSNPARPTRTGHVVLTHSLGESTIDPHAFLYWPPTGLVVTPIDSWSGAGAGEVLVLKVSGNSLQKVGVVANPGSTNDGAGIQRSLLVDGTLWTVSSGGIRVTDPSSLSRQAWIAFS